ncbi:hypothetical protein [Pseudomonas donghuensis]|uniref:hypothetical protein n=1 Tax=Pseudomonas donghuensis TaxID=1163398 RepID=UPI000C2994A3|nr:hypothetical protein [Pseudomonas donghuensis]MCP6697800.1 hypothetical protein [Pseudomonas donghuensis]PJY93365.1 hypothetical protein COO64_26430 [Pseudomonas donghuensis]WKY26100.1 hypothetical protein QYF67_14330 [Pseudomonas donghuensis]
MSSNAFTRSPACSTPGAASPQGRGERILQVALRRDYREAIVGYIDRHIAIDPHPSPLRRLRCDTLLY